jgi:hypothetical protein
MCTFSFDCEYIIILNTSIVIYDFWRLSVLKLHPFNAHIWKSPSPKSLLVDKYENDTHAHVYHQYDTYVAEFQTHFSFGQFIHEDYVSMDATSFRKLLQRGATA